jgi:NAD(P)H-nitrite reductase large subunit
LPRNIPKGWRILVGGNAGARPRLADLLVETTADEAEVLEVIDRIIVWYLNSGREVRLGTLVEEMGIEQFRAAVLTQPEVARAIEQDEQTVLDFIAREHA